MNQQMIGKIAMGIGGLLILVGVAGLLFAGGETTTVVAADDGAGDGDPTSSSTTSSTSSTSTTSSSTSTSTTTSTTTTSTTTTSTTTTTTAPPESVADFFAVLTGAFADGDVDTLFARLNQATLDRYGGDQCRTYLTGIAGTPQPLEFVSTAEVGDWEYATDGVSTSIPGTTSVSVIRTINSTEVPADLHWQRVDGSFTWFTDCGDPV